MSGFVYRPIPNERRRRALYHLVRTFSQTRKASDSTLHSCLDDTELELLGAPWPKYMKAAQQAGIDVLR